MKNGQPDTLPWTMQMLHRERPSALTAASFATEDQEMQARKAIMAMVSLKASCFTYTNSSAPLADRYLYSIVRQNSLTAYILSVELVYR